MGQVAIGARPRASQTGASDSNDNIPTSPANRDGGEDPPRRVYRGGTPGVGWLEV